MKINDRDIENKVNCEGSACYNECSKQEFENSTYLNEAGGPQNTYLKEIPEWFQMEDWMRDLIKNRIAEAKKRAEEAGVDSANLEPHQAPTSYLVDELDRLYEINANEVLMNIRSRNHWVEKFEDAVDDYMEANPDVTKDEAIIAVQENGTVKEYEPPYKEPLNLMVYGEPGGGKTSMIKEWARKKHIAICGFTGGTLTAKVLYGATNVGKAKRHSKKTNKMEEEEVATVLENTSLDSLEDPWRYRTGDPDYEGGRKDFSMLFLDELNRADSKAQGALLDLIQSRSINIPGGGRRYFEWMLMTVAACNPPRTAKEKRGDSYLSQAMGTRFEWMYWNGSPDQTRKFWVDAWEKEIEDLQEQLISNTQDLERRRQKHPERYPKEDIELQTAAIRKDIQERKDKIFIFNTLVDSGLINFDDSEIAQGRAENMFQGNGEGAFKNTLTLNARTLSNAINSSKGRIGRILMSGDKSPSGETVYEKDSLLALISRNAGDSENVQNIIDVLVSAAPIQDIRNGVFNGNLLNIANSVLDRERRRNEAQKKA